MRQRAAPAQDNRTVLYHVTGWLRGARGDFHQDVVAPRALTDRRLLVFIENALEEHFGDTYGAIASIEFDVIYSDDDMIDIAGPSLGEVS